MNNKRAGRQAPPKRIMMPEPLDIDVSFLSRSWLENMPDVEDRCHAAAQAAFAAAAQSFPGGAEVSIVLADDDQVRSLNRDYRGQDKPTNVLSFASLDGDDMPSAHGDGSGPVLLGDVIIAFGVTASEATAEAKTLPDHLTHLVVHGMLHLLGHDHMEPDEAERMEALERDVLGRMGISDPYEELTQDNDFQKSRASVP